MPLEQLNPTVEKTRGILKVFGFGKASKAAKGMLFEVNKHINQCPRARELLIARRRLQVVSSS